MILIDKPYASSFLQETVRKLKIPVIKTRAASEMPGNNEQLFISEEDAIFKLNNDSNALLYTNSENAINWIEKNLKHSDLQKKIKLFKNKVLFRELIKDLYPDYFFKKLAFDELESFDLEELKFPLIVKPAVGFFSLGVKKVDAKNEWKNVISEIKKEISSYKDIYPEEVLDTSNFIIEEFIEGNEFAVDLYYDIEGNAVILNIMQHLFSSDKDVSDRVYMSSKEIIDEHLNKFEHFLGQMGKLADLKNFPAHVELRINSEGIIIPIEVNPLRFGGWCTTADFAWYAFGTNTYENFFFQKKPDWQKIFKNKEDKIFSLIVLDNSTGIPSREICSFDHERLKKAIKNILEYRIIDHQKFKVFGFLFTETKKENIDELYDILRSDLKEYITI